MVYEYPSLKLWELDSSELDASDNPFDWALRAGKCALEGGRDERVKLEYLKSVIARLDSRGWKHDEKLTLLRFTDALLHPKDPQLRMEYDAFREQMSKEGKTMLISVVEERAIERGKEIGKEIGREIGEEIGIEKGKGEGILIGKEETKREAALRMLDKGLAPSLIAECVDLPEEEVLRLRDERR